MPKALIQAGDAAAAEPLIRKGLQNAQDRFPPDHPAIAPIKGILGEGLIALKQYDEAELLLIDSHRIRTVKHAVGNPRRLESIRRIVLLYESWGKPEKAAEYRALLEEAKGGDQLETEEQEPPAQTEEVEQSDATADDDSE